MKMSVSSFDHDGSWLTGVFDQLSISSRGSAARGIDVVCHHVGRPKNTMTAQNDRMIHERVLTCSGFSAGGDATAIVRLLHLPVHRVNQQNLNL